MNGYRKIIKPKLIQWCCEHECLKAAVQIMVGLSMRIKWRNPRTINDKLQVLKLGEYYNNPLITQCCDKVLVKDYVNRRFVRKVKK